MSNELPETPLKVIEPNNIAWIPKDLAQNLDEAFSVAPYNFHKISEALCDFIHLSHDLDPVEKDQDRRYEYIEYAVANYIGEHATAERQYFQTWIDALYKMLEIKNTDAETKYTPTDLAIRLLPHLNDAVGAYLPQDDYLRPKITNIFDQMLPPINNKAKQVLNVCALVLVRTHPEYPLHENAKKQFALALRNLANRDEEDAFDIFAQNIVFFHRMADHFCKNESTKASIAEALYLSTNEAFDIIPKEHIYLRMCVAVRLATNLPRSSPIAATAEKIFNRDFKRCMANEDGLSILENLWEDTGDYSEIRSVEAINPGFVCNIAKKQKAFTAKMQALEAKKSDPLNELRLTVAELTAQNNSLGERLEEVERLLKKALAEVGKPQKTKKPKRRSERTATVVQDAQLKK